MLGQKKEHLISHYKTEGDKAFKEATKENGRIKDEKVRQKILDRAQLCYERWMMLDNENDEAKFSHALAVYEAAGHKPDKTEEKAEEDQEISS